MRLVLLIIIVIGSLLSFFITTSQAKGKKVKENEIKPATHSWVIPFITVKNVKKSLKFYEKCFGFKTAYKNEVKGEIVHAEMKYNDQIVLLLTPEGQHSKTAKTPLNSKTESATLIFLYIKNVDEVFRKCLKNGAKEKIKPNTVPWGERQCHILDIDGHSWQLSELVKKK
ncbi:MAG: hypothetical protein COA79_15930 [Planctomycetota bacterium]|nr:MAG: hypothetical protein COA79_15930 [Planctomycetota bacterium]